VIGLLGKVKKWKQVLGHEVKIVVDEINQERLRS